MANIIGNLIAGKSLSKNPIKLIKYFIFSMVVVYIVLFLLGQFSLPMMLITLAWGVLAGIAANINQY